MSTVNLTNGKRPDVSIPLANYDKHKDIIKPWFHNGADVEMEVVGDPGNFQRQDNPQWSPGNVYRIAKQEPKPGEVYDLDGSPIVITDRGYMWLENSVARSREDLAFHIASGHLSNPIAPSVEAYYAREMLAKLPESMLSEGMYCRALEMIHGAADLRAKS